MATCAVMHLGCKVNRTESDGYERVLRNAGLRPGAVEDADIIVINTCTVTAVADKKARKAVRGALRTNSCAPVIVTGCAAAINPGEFQELSPRVTVVAAGATAAFLQTWADDHRSSDAVDALDEPVHDARTLSRPSVKVQDGCDNRCTYCIVPAARGAAHSVPLESVRREVSVLVESGASEIVLSGINLGAWSEGALQLSDLLQALLPLIGDDARLRLSSIEPDCVTDELIGLLAENDGRICRHLHLPLQSGSEAILKAMGRHYGAEEFATLCERLFKAMPMIALSTDLIVGFPGETDEDFEATCALARRSRFSRIHQFMFSPREGTPAATYDGRPDPTLVRRRAGRLRDLGAALAAEDLERRRGTTETILVEAPGRWRTESYHLLGGDASRVNARPGTLARLRIDHSLCAL